MRGSGRNIYASKSWLPNCSRHLVKGGGGLWHWAYGPSRCHLPYSG